MHSYIFQVSTKPFNADEDYELTEDNAVDYNAGRVDYAYPCEDYEKAVRHLMENILPKGMFTLVTIPSEDEDSDPTYTLRYEGGFEEWAKQYTMHYGLETVGLRYFNVFGRRQDPDGAYAAVIPKFIKMLLHGQTPTINGDGRQSRDFTYIENVIEANLKACVAPSEAAGQAYNIAYGGREYLIDIYYGLTKALGVQVEPNFGPDREGDIKHSNADISKAKRLLGYDPDWSFDRGIQAAIEWYKENL